MPYQSVDGTKGDSDTLGKLHAIRLPDLRGKRLLDVGCNEGFFCLEAVKRGAGRVVGIEKMSSLAQLARERCPEAEILNQTWDTLPNEKFDVILMLSALHYEASPKDLMKRIYDRLAPNGVFILECGVVMEPGFRYVQSARSVGTVYYPTNSLLISYILEDFAVRNRAPSVSQVGDKIPRFVFHCTRRVPTYLIASGPSGIGKTNLSLSLGKKGIVTTTTDLTIIEYSEKIDQIANPNLKEYFGELKSANHIGDWVDGISSLDVAHPLAELLFEVLPKEMDVLFIEGYVFTNSLVLGEFVALLGKKGLRAWCLERKV